MKREKVRLEELRSMAYEDYLLTPEWQETRKAALKRAGNRCQVCRENTALNVYHTTYETLGCEQESDVIALCEACYDLLSQQQKLTPNDSAAETTGDEPAYPHFSFSQRALVFTPSALVGVGLPAFLHAPLPAELFGLGAAIALAINSPKLYAEVRDSLPTPLVTLLDGLAERKRTRAATGEWSKWDRLLGRHLREYAPDQTDEDDTLITDEEDSEIDDQQPEEDPAFAHEAGQIDVPGVPRLTIEQIVSHIKRNSYEAYIGRSMTRPNNPAVKINFYKRHLKLLGASQHGKTSMATALLECILRTHDPNYVQIALLDHENKASRLFANAPHIAKVRVGEQVVRLYANSEPRVLEHLEYIVKLIDYRYNHLSEEELDQQPLVIVYLEEFIDLKDYFKHRIDQVKDKDEKEQAKQDYARLVACIKKIARRGLKVLVQLLLCTQADYRDEDLQEALVNITSGMSFCLRVSATQAAGFYQTELLQRNAREDKVGQAVAEMPDCKDLVLAPANDLHARLKALGKAQQQDDAPKDARLSLTPEIDRERQIAPSRVAAANEEQPANASPMEKATHDPLTNAQKWVLKVWNETGKRTHREIGAYLRSRHVEMSDSKVYSVMIELEERQLIVRQKKGTEAIEATV
jgi:hypothetical protein